ncbi:MAG: hypothetical protein ACRC62_15500 [Microcoleus sp.]
MQGKTLVVTFADRQNYEAADYPALAEHAAQQGYERLALQIDGDRTPLVNVSVKSMQRLAAWALG